MVSGVYNIATDLPFADCLAGGILEQHALDEDPLALGRVLVLLPTRRGCRSLREAFLRRTNGRPVLLPRLVPLGDIDEGELGVFALDEDPAGMPPIGTVRRNLLLAGLIEAHVAATRGVGTFEYEDISVDQAVRLATALAGLLDQVQTEQLSFDGLRQLVPGEYAEHWQLTLRFLAILTEHWPAILAESGHVDPVVYRNARLDRLAQIWRTAPPSTPVIAAGSTGSVPATAALLEAIADMPRGVVVLPALDQELDEESWDCLTPAHPQFQLAQLLRRFGVTRDAVGEWPVRSAWGRSLVHRPQRLQLLREVMRPAETTGDPAQLTEIPPAAWDGLERIDCATEQEEAGVVALIMRGVLAAGGGDLTCALVTPDRQLARRVAAELARWRIEIDDSAGTPLANTPPGTFLRLIARAFADRFAPVPLLAMLKHPLALGDEGPGAFRAQVRALERAALRGPRPAPGFTGLIEALRESRWAQDETVRWVETWAAAAADMDRLMAAETQPLARLLEAHIAFAELLSGAGGDSGTALWRGDAGEAAAAFVEETIEAAVPVRDVATDRYPALLDALTAGRAVRPRYGQHPRLAILGPLEARLQQYDVMILGGLNEGTWPPEPDADPWMSRQMRRAFGLSPTDRRVGQSAHDFSVAFCAAQIYLTRARRVGGTPTVASRWLTRLDNIRQAVAGDTAAVSSWPAWWQRIDHGSAAFVPNEKPPTPRPPVAARPRRLSVTQVERWLRDPYEIYAKHVLRLKLLDPIDAEPGAAEYGQLVHVVLDRFVRTFPSGALPADAVERLLAIGEDALSPMRVRPGVWAFWWPRFQGIARWFIEMEQDYRRAIIGSLTEIGGELSLDGPQGSFVLSAVADRIDRLAGGGAAIIDYKTGTPPGAADIKAGLAAQLPLEAGIARYGGFEGLDATPVVALTYWRLRGGNAGCEIIPVAGEPDDLSEQALGGLRRLIAAFDDERTAYVCRPRPDIAPRFSDYIHLARVPGWASADDDAP